MEAPPENVVETLARLSLFADLSYPELEGLAHSFEERFAKDQRVIRQDMPGGSFYVILEGEASVVIDGEERARSRGAISSARSPSSRNAPTATNRRDGAAVSRHPGARLKP